jgi:hypothetical protein
MDSNIVATPADRSRNIAAGRRPVPWRHCPDSGRRRGRARWATDRAGGADNPRPAPHSRHEPNGGIPGRETHGHFTTARIRARAIGHGDAGFTIIEVLAAICILTVAVLGVVGALVLQRGVSSSFDSGQAAVNRGHFVSTATFLAQDRIEQIKRLRYTLTPPPVDEIGAGSPPAGLPDEDYGTIAGYPEFRREVSVQAGVPAADLKTVTVTVRFQRRSDTRTVNENIQLRTIVAARP